MLSRLTGGTSHGKGRPSSPSHELVPKGALINDFAAPPPPVSSLSSYQTREKGLVFKSVSHIVCNYPEVGRFHGNAQLPSYFEESGENLQISLPRNK